MYNCRFCTLNLLQTTQAELGWAALWVRGVMDSCVALGFVWVSFLRVTSVGFSFSKLTPGPRRRSRNAPVSPFTSAFRAPTRGRSSFTSALGATRAAERNPRGHRRNRISMQAAPDGPRTSRPPERPRPAEGLRRRTLRSKRRRGANRRSNSRRAAAPGIAV